MKGHFLKLLDHMRWADGRVLERIRAQPSLDRERRLFGHVLAAERVWLARVTGEDASGIELWPDPTAEQCAAWAEDAAAGWARYIGSLDQAVSGRVAYRRGDGAEYVNAIEDVLTHLFMHGAYHRGQIALGIRDAGGEPANTDYITFVREMGLDPITSEGRG